MNSRIKYIELKTGYSDDGPAWIGLVEFSKTKKTVYFNGKAFRYLAKGNYEDIETGECYWISGVKKNGEDRHYLGKGKIMIDKEIVESYLKWREYPESKSKVFEIVDIQKTDKSKFTLLINEKLEKGFDYNSLIRKEIHTLLNDELEFLIAYSWETEQNSIYNKGRRSVKKYRLNLENEQLKRYLLPQIF